MSRFATLPPTAPTRSSSGIGIPIVTETFEGGAGFTPGDPHAELFNAAVSGMLADRFYESGDARVARLVDLVPQCDPAWLLGFTGWLRDAAYLRSAPIVIGAEYARAGMPNARTVVASALKRADEPAEMLGYWLSRYGRNVPSRVKRGIADAVTRLYTERSLLQWDGSSKAWRFGDVVEFVHPTPNATWQSDLFKFALDRRRHPTEIPPETLPMVRATLLLENVATSDRRERLDEAVAAGFSWERLAGWLPDGMDADAWSAVLPNMGYMATLRNLNNFDRAGVQPADVNTRLTDPEQIAKSKVMPFRYLTAYLNLEADTYKIAVNAAADVALANLPTFKGSTLIMVDCSGSMSDPVGAGRSRNPLRLSQAAGFMAEALARRCDTAEIVCYTTEPRLRHEPARHVGVLRASSDACYQPDGGTSTWHSTETAYSGQDRVVVLTDEQTSDSDSGLIRCPVVTWNLAGYQPHHAAHGSRNRFFVAGYNDTALQLLPSIVAAGSSGRWPWTAV